MANNYYNVTTTFIPGTKARSDEVNTEYQGIAAAFDLLPDSTSALTTGKATLGTESGAASAYVLTMADTRLANADGDEIVFLSTHTNTGAATIDVDTIGAVPLVRADGSAMESNDIVSGLFYVARYDNTNTRFQLIGPSASYLTNAAASAAAAASSETAAGVSETNAAASEAAAASSETNSGLNVGYAEQWAIQPEDTPVTVAAGGDGATTFSALHWAAKASGSSGLPAIVGGDALKGLRVNAGETAYELAVLYTTTGLEFLGSLGNDPTAGGNQDTLLAFQNSAGALNADVGFTPSGTIFKLINRVHGGEIQIKAENNAGTETFLIDGDPEADVSLYHIGIRSARTLTAATGGLEVNNTLTGAGLERVLTTSDLFRGAAVYNTGSQTVAGTTPVTVLFDSEQYDTDAIHDTGSNTSRLTVPTGVTKVRITAQVRWDSNTTGERRLRLLKNGSTNVGAGAPGGNLTTLADLANISHELTTGVLDVVATDYFEITVAQGSGGSRTILGGVNDGTFFTMEIIG